MLITDLLCNFSIYRIFYLILGIEIEEMSSCLKNSGDIEIRVRIERLLFQKLRIILTKQKQQKALAFPPLKQKQDASVSEHRRSRRTEHPISVTPPPQGGSDTEHLSNRKQKLLLYLSAFYVNLTVQICYCYCSYELYLWI